MAAIRFLILSMRANPTCVECEEVTTPAIPHTARPAPRIVISCRGARDAKTSTRDGERNEGPYLAVERLRFHFPDIGGFIRALSRSSAWVWIIPILRPS